MAANLLVRAHLIVVKDAERVQHYLRRGADLPDWVDKDHVKQLRDAGLVEQVRARKAPPAKAEKAEQDQPAGGGDQS